MTSFIFHRVGVIIVSHQIVVPITSNRSVRVQCKKGLFGLSFTGAERVRVWKWELPQPTLLFFGRVFLPRFRGGQNCPSNTKSRSRLQKSCLKCLYKFKIGFWTLRRCRKVVWYRFWSLRMNLEHFYENLFWTSSDGICGYMYTYFWKLKSHFS